MNNSHAELTMLALAVMNDVDLYVRKHHVEFEANYLKIDVDLN